MSKDFGSNIELATEIYDFEGLVGGCIRIDTFQTVYVRELCFLYLRVKLNQVYPSSVTSYLKPDFTKWSHIL